MVNRWAAGVTKALSTTSSCTALALIGARPMADQLLTAAMVHLLALGGFLTGIATLWAINRACRAARAGLRWCWQKAVT